MNRRGFLKGILAAGVAPYVVSSGVLMPVKKIWTPEMTLLWTNGDTAVVTMMDGHILGLVSGLIDTDPNSNILKWNGDAWTYRGHDVLNLPIAKPTTSARPSTPDIVFPRR